MSTDGQQSLLERKRQLQEFFDQTHIYLNKDSHVMMRVFTVRQLLGTLENISVLDVGCGDGRPSLQYLSPSNGNANRVTLVDLSPKMLALAEKNIPAGMAERVTLVNADMDSFSAPQPFDVVICLGVLAHVASVTTAVARLSSFVRPGGYCVIQLTDHQQFIGRFLGWFYRLVNTSRLGYAVNPTRFSEVDAMAQSHGLVLRRQVQYWPLLPGMGRLPDRWLLKYQMATANQAFFSRMGAEKLLLYQKRLADPE